jgi:hypothetical protein
MLDPADTDTAACLAREHDARTLAAALVARLRADGRTELADAVVAMLPGGFIDGTPPHPHRGAAPT